MIISVIENEMSWTTPDPASALVWARQHTTLPVDRMRDVIRRMMRMWSNPRRVTFRASPTGRTHLTATWSNMLVTCFLDDPDSLKAWRSDGTIPVRIVINVVVPELLSWSYGRMACARVDNDPGTIRIVRVHVLATDDPPLIVSTAHVVGSAIRLGWRFVHDDGAFPERTMAYEKLVDLPTGVPA